MAEGKISGYDRIRRIGKAEIQYLDRGTSGSVAVQFADANVSVLGIRASQYHGGASSHKSIDRSNFLKPQLLNATLLARTDQNSGTVLLLRHPRDNPLYHF